MNKYFGDWALVTGASSGIGEEFCRQIAAAKMNVVLVARRREQLETLATEISAEHGIETMVITQDLVNQDAATNIATKTSGLNIGLFISNAGDGAMGGFLKREAEEFQKAMKLNLITPVALMHHFLTEMRLRQNGGGLILVSSAVAVTGAPYIGDYSATKAYQLHLGQALHHELKSNGIHVSVLMPGPTKTEAYNRDDIDFNKLPVPPMSVEHVVRAALKGVIQNKLIVIPGVMNKVMDFFTRRVMSRSMGSKIFGFMMKGLIPEKYRYE